MEEFWILILVAYVATNSLDKTESVQLIDEIFGEGWWDNNKAEEWHKLTLEQHFHHPIDQQNAMLGQIEPNSTDQNAPFTESDHSDRAKNAEEQNEKTKEITLNEKRKIIEKFHAIKDEFKQKEKHSKKERVKIEEKIAKHLKVNRAKIYKWKKEFGLSQKRHNFGKEKEERKNLVEKFDQMKADLKRNGFKNSYNHEIDETVAKELGLSVATIYNWKSELGLTKPNKCEQKKLMKLYYEIKDKTPKISDENIAKMLKIGSRTLCRWKKQFKRQQLYPNSVDGQSVEENFGPTIQDVGNSELNE